MLHSRLSKIGSLTRHVRMLSSKNVDPAEVNKFAMEAASWWENAKMLLRMNGVRIPYIRENVKLSNNLESVNNVSVVDIGCGGGFLSESLARTGFKVTGIDPAVDMVAVAEAHQSLDPSIKNNLQYENCSVDELVKQNAQFDVAVASEVVEHVADLDDFLMKMSQIVKPGGSLFFTTINRTTMSYWLAIIGAEYILRLLEQGTHNWEQFVTPTELTSLLKKRNVVVKSIQGITYNPLFGQWSLTSSTDVNYMAHFIKPSTLPSND